MFSSGFVRDDVIDLPADQDQLDVGYALVANGIFINQVVIKPTYIYLYIHTFKEWIILAERD